MGLGARWLDSEPSGRQRRATIRLARLPHPSPSPLTHRSPVLPADRIIDSHDNEYVLSKPNIEGSLGLTLDPQLIRDMSLLIITSALAGQLMSALGQPTINGA